MDIEDDVTQAENEIMLMGYEIRFWRNKAIRSEQQRDQVIKEKALLEEKLEKFNGVTDEMIERVKLEMKKEELKTLRLKLKSLVNISDWMKATREEETISDLDEKIRYLVTVIKSPCVEEDQENSEDNQMGSTKLFLLYHDEDISKFNHPDSIPVKLQQVEKLNKIDFYQTIISSKMDSIQIKRNKKSDKAKEKHDRNGGFSQKHVRIAEALASIRQIKKGKRV